MDLAIVLLMVLVLKKKGKDAWNLIFLPPSHERKKENNGEKGDPTPPSATSQKLQLPALISRRENGRSKMSLGVSQICPYAPRHWD